MTRFRGMSAFTLAEILVAISIFVMLGSMLVMALTSGVETWRRTEDRRMIYAESQIVLRQIERDLIAVAAPRALERGAADVRMICDLDINNRYRLRLVRTIRGEDENEATRYAGSGPPDKFAAVMDMNLDSKKSLMPLGGLMEVAYLMDPDPKSSVLYRVVRSPIGGKGSLFDDSNLNTSEKVRKTGVPVSDGVLFLGFHFWTQYTSTWDLSAPMSTTLGSTCGPEIFWDSTRGILPGPKSPEAKKARSTFWLAAGASSLKNPADDLFPLQVRVFLSVTGKGSGPHTFLDRPLGKKDKTVYVDNAGAFPADDDPDLFRYVFLGGEWIHYKDRTSSSFLADDEGRGARGTRPLDHAAGSEVFGGRTFVQSVKMPVSRTFWQGSDMSKLLARNQPADPPWLARMKKGPKDSPLPPSKKGK